MVENQLVRMKKRHQREEGDVFLSVGSTIKLSEDFWCIKVMLPTNYEP